MADILSKIGAEGLTDIVLLSNDGGQVPASRFVISARSAVFQSLLFRTGENLNQQVLQLDYSTNIVQALVKYCCTNELPEEGWRARTEGVARELVRLYDAAAAFDLAGLNALLCQKITVLVQTHPNLACAIYDECSSYSCSLGASVPTPGNPRGRHSGDTSNTRTPQVLEKPKAIALKAIRHNPMAALLKKNEHGNQEAGVSALGMGTIEEIIGDQQMHAEEITMFRAIIIWADALFVGGDGDGGVNYAYRLQERRLLAKSMVSKCINLSNIPPSQLLGFVSECNLVEEKDIMDAITSLALRVEIEGYPVSKLRGDNRTAAASPKAVHQPDALPLLNTTQSTEGMSLLDNDDLMLEGGASDFAYQGSLPPPPPPPPPPLTSIPPTPPQPKADPKKSKKGGKIGPKIPWMKMSFGQRIGFYFADKVDTMCVQPHKEGFEV